MLNMSETEFRKYVRADAKNLRAAMNMVFPTLFKKMRGVTMLEFNAWLVKNCKHSPRMIWDKEKDRMLLVVQDFKGNHRTHVMGNLIQRIERENA